MFDHKKNADDFFLWFNFFAKIDVLNGLMINPSARNVDLVQ